MSQRILTVSVDLSHPLVVHPIPGIMGGGDRYADIIRVLVYQNGEPVTLSGTVTGYVMNRAGDTFVIDGVCSGNGAQVQLIEEVYELPGPITIAVRLVNGDVKTTLAICSTAVKMTATTTVYDPGEIVPDLDDVRARLAEVIAATNAANSAAAFYPMTYAGPVSFPEGKQEYYAIGNWTAGEVIADKASGANTHYVIELGGLIEGETFTITARDGSTAQPWGIIDKDRRALAWAGTDRVTNRVITVPEGGDGGTLIVQASSSYIGSASVVRNMNLSKLDAVTEMISERLNLFDDTLTYTQRKKDGTTNGVRTPTDGVYTTNLNNGSHGSYSWALPDKTLPAGTYTLSAYVDLASTSNREIYMGIGYGSREIVDLTTERGGDTPIGSSDKAGWVKYTYTVPEDAVWAVQLLPINASDNGSEISQIQLEIGEEVTEYTEDKRIAVDEVARAALANIETKPEVDASVPFASLAALQASAGSADSFLFFTDPHLCEVQTWRPGFDKWMQIFGSYYKQLSVHFTLCGGDWMGNADTPDEAQQKLALIYTEMRKRFNVFHMCVGNHDTNEQGKLTPESLTWTGRLDPQGGANLWYNGRSYYDFTTPSARYFILDTGGEGNGDPYAYYFTAEKKWLADQLLANTAENVVFVQHIVYKASEVDSNGQPTTSTPEHAVASVFLQIAQAFNTRVASFSVGNTTYNFSNAVGKVRFVIAGHTHHDSISTAYGLPIWITGRTVTSDITELRRLDLVVADFTNRVVQAIRIGSATTSPAIRTMNMTT